jgi:hypothetical protein
MGVGVKRAVVTWVDGAKWEELAKITFPRMESYAKRTEQDFIAIAKALTDPPQYTKSVIANFMATKGLEQVTFFDADVLIAADCEDIGESCGGFKAFDEGAYLDRKAGMAKLASVFGGHIEPRFYVNTGVFVATNRVMGIFSMPPLATQPNHFGEQTWLNIMAHLWGVTLEDLDPVYNCMTSAEEHFGLDRHKDAKIIHYAGQSGDMDKLMAAIRADDDKLKELGR